MPAPADSNRSPTASRVLGAVALAALLWGGYEGWALRGLSQPLHTPAAPRGMVSLQLAPTTAQARTILLDWSCEDSKRDPCANVSQVATGALARDSRFILAYVTAWVLVALWAGTATRVPWWVTALLIAAIISGGILDLAENWLHGIALGNADVLPFAGVAPLLPGLVELVTTSDPLHHHAFTLARLAAMSKFVLLLLGIAGSVAVAAGGLRLIFVRRQLKREGMTAGLASVVSELEPTITSFAELVERETDGIFRDIPNRTRDYPRCELHAAADEQYVAFRAADVIGMALSGGGIRSATFNLGLLQGLHRLHLLRLFDYMSTVSGGGYVGSFWSAWLARQTAEPGTADWEAALFPTTRTESTQGRGPVETDQERHVREFSGFLAPRWGFFEVETWTAIVALLAGLVPALLIGLSVLGVTLIAWLALTFPLASPSQWAPALVVGLATALVFYFFERMWQELRRETAGHSTSPTKGEQEASARGQLGYRIFAGITVTAVVVAQVTLPAIYSARFGAPWPIHEGALAGAWHQAPMDSGLVRWWAVTGIADSREAWIFSPRLFDYGVVWLACGLGLVMARMAYSVWPWPWRRETLAAFDRVLMRVLGMSAVWFGMSTLWHLTINLEGLVAVIAGGAIVSGGVFAALRRWIGVALRRPSEARVVDRLKPLLPSALAYLTLVLTSVTVGAMLIWLAGVDWLVWWEAAAGMLAVLVAALFVNPDEFGLHAFYRERICRAYAGASNLAAGQGATDNRSAEAREGDDPRLSSLKARPLHLVCCAANDLSGDQVETLGRGARSAVLSKYGISLGRFARAWAWYSPGNRLGSAVTASAAAFNSNMGHISIRVGPAVSFLMTMLNLRLGLWVRHPAAGVAAPRRWPGALYYREMLALTSSSGHIPPGRAPERFLRDVHVSDGGHFENLAVYELVRRHCRYILLSDCGADPTVAFDDLGNALRRIREDFGVDVSLDVSPLAPGPNGMSRQHIAVGTIHYSQTDKGILLYIKPSITGDEPPDVLQYRTRNTAFPHEATTDQFYDEAQWESYRRLGLHAAETIFHFVAREDAGTRSADWVFAEASHQWGPTPEGLEDRVLKMTKRFGVLEAELQQRQSRGLLADVFPEMRYIPAEVKEEYASPSTPGGSLAQGPGTPVDADAAIALELALLLRVTQLMEDVWLACDLDRWWMHPLNLGWINLFARWATSPAFRFWWPLLAPMFGPGFRRFIHERFPLREQPSSGSSALAVPQNGVVEEVAHPRQSGLAALWWEERSTQPIDWDKPVPAPFARVFYQDMLELPRAQARVRMQVGLAAVTSREQSVGWTSDDFFVPPSLWGAGIGWYFLKNLLGRLSDRASWCVVVAKAPREGQRHQVARDDRESFVEQYRKMGFREARAGEEDSSAIDVALCTQLGYNPSEDTLLVLDLAQWARRKDG